MNKDPVGFLVDSGGFVRLDRFTDGSVMCCICFDIFAREDLADIIEEPSKKWDMCKPCQLRESYAMLFLLMAGWRKNYGHVQVT